MYVTLGKNTTAARDGIGGGRPRGQGIQLLRLRVQQPRHAVDEGTGSARAAIIHPRIEMRPGEEHLGVLAAQLDDSVRARIQGLGSHFFRIHLLHEGEIAGLCNADARAAAHRQQYFLCRRKYRAQFI